MSQRVYVLVLCLIPIKLGGDKAKASPNRANLYLTYDPKLGELTMGRMNPDENREEVRTRCR